MRNSFGRIDRGVHSPAARRRPPRTAPVEDRSGTRATGADAGRAPPAARPAAASPASRGGHRRARQSAARSEQHPVEAQHLLRLRQLRRQGRVQAASSRRTRSYLQPTATRAMTLQGHTDERGSREYNIALGQKRADAVKRMMTLLGAHGEPDRDGELRQGKAAERGPRRSRVGGEPPRRHRVRRRMTTRLRIARRAAGVRAPRGALAARRCSRRLRRRARAHAALFDDEEARKRIDGTNQRLDAGPEPARGSPGGARAAGEEQGLVDLVSADRAHARPTSRKLRGQIEVLTYELEQRRSASATSTSISTRACASSRRAAARRRPPARRADADARRRPPPSPPRRRADAAAAAPPRAPRPTARGAARLRRRARPVQARRLPRARSRRFGSVRARRIREARSRRRRSTGSATRSSRGATTARRSPRSGS